MLTEEQKRQIEMTAAQQIRDGWGGLNGARVRGVIDDVRTKVVEGPWFGEAKTGSLNDRTFTGQIPDQASLSDLYGTLGQTLQSAWESVFGREQAQPEQGREASEPEAPAQDRKRDGPEIGG